MKKLEFWKGTAEVFIEDDPDGNTITKMQWFCTDGVSTYYGNTKSEAAAHFGVPVGFDNEIKDSWVRIEYGGLS